MNIIKMPEIWNSEIAFLPCELAGAFTKWAVRQSPYIYPDNLVEAIEAVDKFSKKLHPEYIETTCGELAKNLEEFFEDTEVIRKWNNRKNGNISQHEFVSRFDKPSPDADFIDLSALARNVAHDITLHDIYQKAQDSTYSDEV